MSASNQGKDDNNRLTQAMSAAANITDKLLNTVSDVVHKFETPRTRVNIKDTLGKEAEISVAIPQAGTGEVILSLAGTLHSYSAQAADRRRAFKRGTKVRVIDAANQIVYVDEI
jgi:hypothetical protein